MSNVANTQFQAGIETVRGTAVAATRKVYMRGPIPDETRPKTNIEASFPTFAAHIDTVEDYKLGKLPLEGEMSFDTIHFWMQLAMKGGVSPSGSGPYTYDFPNDSTVDDLDTATIEASDDVAAVEMPYALCTDWELSGADGKGPKPIMFKHNYIGQTVTKGITMTPALADLPLAGTYGAFSNSALYVDGAVGSIGTTEWENALMAWSFKVNNQIAPLFPGGNGGQFTAIERGRRFAEVKVDLLLNATMYSEWQNAWENSPSRYCRIAVTGPSNRVINLDFHAKWESFVPTNNGNTRRVVLMSKSLYDPTWGYDFSVQVVNNESGA